MPDSELITILQLKDLGGFPPTFPTDRHAGFCIPDLAHSANTSSAFLGSSGTYLSSEQSILIIGIICSLFYLKGSESTMLEGHVKGLFLATFSQDGPSVLSSSA